MPDASAPASRSIAAGWQEAYPLLILMESVPIVPMLSQTDAAFERCDNRVNVL
jgi:hypothetical protein